MLDPDTSELRRITNHPDDEFEPSWSRDGRTIYFGSNRTGRDEIWRMPAMGGEPVQMTRQGGETAIESPDGRYLYYARNDPSGCAVWRVPVGGGEEQPVVDGLSHPLNFVVATRGIYFLGVGNRRNETSLDFYDYASGKRSKLVTVGKPFWWGMALAPDEKSLLYSVVDNAGSNLMLVDNFR
jgi:Tol biopolymer transport system component